MITAVKRMLTTSISLFNLYLFHHKIMKYKKLNRIKKTNTICSLFLFLLSPQLKAEDKIKIEQSVKTYAVDLSRSRIIYNPSSSGEVIYAENKNDFPILVQTTITPDNKSQKQAPFIATPPLFRLDPEQRSSIKVLMTDSIGTTDRESLYWMCVNGVPPKKSDIWADGATAAPANTALLNIQIKTSQCIKLLLRPAALTDKPEHKASQVTWTAENGKLKASNPTPYYMNLRSLSINGTEIGSPTFIPPKGEAVYSLPSAAKTSGGTVRWVIINDLGGDSAPLLSTVK